MFARGRDDGVPTRKKYEFDVFISYSSRDKEWVHGELLKRIEKAGLKAFIDFRDFTRGAPSIKECERGVLKCRKTLLVLTPHYVESEWCELEGVMAQTLSPANHDLRIIPLLKTDCEKPLRIGALTHIDFTDGADLNLAWRQLLTALGKPPEPEPPKQPQPDHWFLPHPYPMPPNFTGRAAEREMLNRWLDADAAHPMLVLRALGGFGKSALAWHWLTHDVDPAAWPRVVWWSFYEGDASFDHFLAETLEYLGGGNIPPDNLSGKNAVKTLWEMLREPGILLVLDGFERVLRVFSGMNAAYQGDEAEPGEPACRMSDRDCVSPLAEMFLYNVALQPHLRSKVLLTTRLRPRVLEAKGAGLLQGCREEELRQMQPADAVEFFRAQGIRGTHTEIEQACAPYGYHPLSLCLVAGLVVGNVQQPGDIAAAKRLDVSGDLVHCQHHVLETAYNSLTPARRALLSRIACFRSPVKYEALKALAEEAEKSAANLDADLQDMVARGLLHHETKEGRFDLHPIVRRYAYDRLAAPDRAAAHTRLRDYFAAVPRPEKVTRLEDLAPVIELYHHTVRAGQFNEAFNLFYDRLHDAVFFQFGAYQLQIDLLHALFPDGEDRPPRLKKKRHQSWAACALAGSYALSGQPGRAATLVNISAELNESENDKTNLAVDLENLATQQLVIGELRATGANQRRHLALCREIKEEITEAFGQNESGRLLTYRGAYVESETELATALKVFEKQKDVQAQCVSWAYRALRELLLMRSSDSSALRFPNSALESARRALELAEGGDPNLGGAVVPRDLVRAHWLLGAAYRVAGQPDEAERHLNEALERCRRINLVEMEADILIDLARLRAATPSTSSGQAGALDEAQRLAEEALLITERSGYVLQGADARLELAKLALARGDKPAALEHAKEARRLATCDGPPDYTYKAAYDEAGKLLAELGA
jgi:tetratricopeptide (TPR) repeat protein